MKFNNKNLYLLLLLFTNFSVYGKKVINKNNTPWFKIVNLQDALQKNLEIQYIKLLDEFFFDYPVFSIASQFPSRGYFEELFVLKILNAQVQGKNGHVLINNQIIKELIWDQRYDLFLLNAPRQNIQNIQKVSGNVAVISQFGYNNYFHWLNEILGRLALLEMNHIEYDWLYVADEMPYTKETLELWGVDTSKIISVKDNNFSIYADELILPSLLSNTSVGHNHAGSFIHPVTMQYVREKMLRAVEQKNIDRSKFSKKIFVSRNDAYASRRILNEDEIFELFAKKGFVRYELAKMSVAEQIMLFHEADVVVAEQGSGLTNILFCKQGTRVYEIFQAMVDNCFWWQSNVLGLQYFPCQTISIDANYFAQCKTDMRFYQNAWQSRVVIPIESIQKIIETL